METSENLAAQIVNSACQKFGQLTAQKAVLVVIAQKAGRQAEILKTIAMFLLVLLVIMVMFTDYFTKQSAMAFLIVFTAIVVILLSVIFISLLREKKERNCRQNIKTIANGRLNYIKGVINRVLMEHICTNDDSYTEDFYFKQMKKITSGFFANDFNSSLTEKETTEIRSWLRASYSACLRAD